MPAYNEETGIEEFLSEIEFSLKNFQGMFVIVDDCSLDSTYLKLKERSLKEKTSRFPIFLFRNERNKGHGPTFTSAIKNSIDLNPVYIISTDGDGQFLGEDIRNALNYAIEKDFDILECVRSSRSDPVYRKVVTYLTRLLVWSKTGNLPADANTPLRVYKLDAVREIWANVSSETTIPNLQVSILTRKLKFNRGEFTVTSIPRRGENSIGTMWRTSNRYLPSRYFIVFCLSAVREFFYL
jgi:glycosyltransferase involved in cell wall biosynthesis